ncbi:MAG: CHASE2 domain-containing protein [Cyanobacteria bacterium P01_F01_bin.3]
MLGRTLKDRYKLTRILGAGGFGQTYLAVDLQQSTRPQCVVKQLRPASQDKTFLSVARRLFDTESNTLKKLGNHSQIPTSLDFFEEDSEFYLVQEYIDGQSLEDEIKQAGKFTEEQAIALLKDVLPVLDFIHDNHVVHRDLKPDNLIRRHSNCEVVLIDFGAVKEIRTHLITGERTGLTIGIGTQGYTPSEQLSGKPRYSSDIYALGMTVIHALTGQSPTDLPESLGSLEPQWRYYAEVSPGLAIVLDKMTRHYIHQRYQSVKDVLHDLGRLEELPAEAAEAVTSIETSMPGGLASSEAKTVIVRWRMKKRARVLTVALSTLITSAVIVGLRQVGVFVPAELAIWDKQVNARKDLGPDPRLLIVGVTENDLSQPGSFTPSDTELSQAIDNLQAHQPARIGIDFLRSQAEGEGKEALQANLKDPNVLAVMRLSDPNRNNLVLPPPGMMLEQLSFSNVVEDSDLRVRRALMLDFLDAAVIESDRGENLGGDIGNVLDSDPVEQPIFSFGTEAAIHYLEKYENIVPEGGEILQLGDVRFEPLKSTFGGYQSIDAGGYQMFLRYRSQHDIAERVSFTDILNNSFDPALVKDKIVLIGSTTESSKDLFVTPFVEGGTLQKMYGVEIHAQVASQILSAVIDGEPLPWAWPDGLEILWIVALTGIGSGLMVLTQRGPVLIFFGVSGLALTWIVSLVCFQLGGWVPVVAPMSAFFFSAAGTRISKSYQRRHWEARQTTIEEVEPA